MKQSREGKLEDIFQKFTQDFGLYSVAQIVPSLLGVVALMLFTRVFPPVAYGRYALAMTFVGLLSTLGFGWIQQSISRFEPQLDDSELVENVLSVFLVAGLVVVIGTVAGYLLFDQFLGDYQEFYFAAAALVLGQGTFRTLNVLFRIRLQSNSFTKYKLLLGVMKLVFAVVLAVFVLDSIVGWMWGHALTLFLISILMARESGVLKFSPHMQSELLTRFARYGFPMIGWLLGMTLLQFADRVLIEFFRGTSSLGVYAPNYSLVQRGLFLALTPIGQAAQPLMMNTWDGENTGKIRDLMTDFTRYFFIIGIPATIFAAVMSWPLSTLLLAEQYQEGYLVIVIVAPGMFLWNAALLGHTGFEIKERTEVMVLGVSGAVILNLVLNVLLIKTYGYLGAAVATSISFASYAIFAYIASRWSIRWQLPTRTIRNTIVGGIAMAAPSVMLYISDTYTLVRAFTTAGLGIVLYVSVLYVLNEFRTEEVSTIIEQIWEQ
ncbi:lipopolysaccharide biosynthesis protein [Halococcus saccharolyticus]|uniref:Polysaccharide biosynthesis protein n=1 Tax=Halococcus saccharolyticus DSM 5350 TaxID=1227455 RepID=M0MNT9_9EURY|nr:lipopolysaccharide biosynthesis protein [Halococcus saccharolyticus]EMA47331.1 polysaccharide biosynthesis protein [Halococcus saccharolyticus DSM 5350]